MKKQRRIKWATRAKRDLRNITGYIAKDNEQAADELALYVLQVIDHLTVSPIGRRIGELSDTFERVLTRYPAYLIIFQYDEATLHVLRIFHTAQESKTWLA